MDKNSKGVNIKWKEHISQVKEKIKTHMALELEWKQKAEEKFYLDAVLKEEKYYLLNRPHMWSFIYMKKEFRIKKNEEFSRIISLAKFKNEYEEYCEWYSITMQLINEE